jgi:hypothetical protein
MGGVRMLGVNVLCFMRQLVGASFGVDGGSGGAWGANGLELGGWPALSLLRGAGL